MNPDSDFAAMLSALNAAGAEYMVVGGYAVAFHAEPRYTKDLDIWVRPTPDNARRVMQALAAFGAPLGDLALQDLYAPGTVFQIGVEPVRVDILTSVDPLNFEAAWALTVATSFSGVPMRVIGRDDLVAAKRFANRPRDRGDVKRLQAAAIASISPEPCDVPRTSSTKPRTRARRRSELD